MLYIIPRIFAWWWNWWARDHFGKLMHTWTLSHPWKRTVKRKLQFLPDPHHMQENSHPMRNIQQIPPIRFNSEQISPGRHRQQGPASHNSAFSAQGPLSRYTRFSWPHDLFRDWHVMGSKKCVPIHVPLFSFLAHLITRSIASSRVCTVRQTQHKLSEQKR